MIRDTAALNRASRSGNLAFTPTRRPIGLLAAAAAAAAARMRPTMIRFVRGSILVAPPGDYSTKHVTVSINGEKL